MAHQRKCIEKTTFIEWREKEKGKNLFFLLFHRGAKSTNTTYENRCQNNNAVIVRKKHGTQVFCRQRVPEHLAAAVVVERA